MTRIPTIALVALPLGALACGGEGSPGGNAQAPDTGASDSSVTAAAEGLADSVRTLEGMVIRLAGAATFAECRTGTTYPIAQEGEYLALERAYLADRRSPDAPLLVRLRGRAARRPGTQGGEVTMLVVESVQGTKPGAGCGEREADLPLEGTEWVLSELGGEPVPEGVRATLVLDGTEDRVRGSGGCNAFTGSYRLEGARLTFGSLAGTLRGCAGPEAGVEEAYLKVLGRVAGYRLTGASLELLAEEGTVARFLSP